MGKKYKHSLNRQIAFIFIGLMSLIVGCCLLANNLMLEDYYILHKQEALRSAYYSLNRADRDNSFSVESFDVELQKICDRYSLDVIVLDMDSQMVKYIGKNPTELKLKLWEHLFDRNSQYFDSGSGSEDGSDNGGRVLMRTEEYELCISTDEKSGLEYIEIWGTLESGNIFLISSAIESIQDSVAIANRFLAYLGCIAILVGAIVIIFISKKITSPLLQLAEISKRMANLDFDAKYDGTSDDEIGLLGDNINKLSESLEKTVSELKSANIELQKDIADKTKIDEMRKEFLANVSHELKTPIALIQGYAEGLEEGVGDDPENREYYLNVIRDEASKMNTLVQKLLTLNQLEFGNDTTNMDRFDIVGLVRGCIQSTEILTKQNDISVTYPAEESLYVWGDEFKIEEVFTNYLSNAINHCSGDKRIDIKISRIAGKARVTVFNTGERIPEDSIEHIWEKFYKVDKARTRAYGGSGVGLSIVKAIMDAMKGTYGVDNYEDGVAFWFELDVE